MGRRFFWYDCYQIPTNLGLCLRTRASAVSYFCSANFSSGGAIYSTFKLKHDPRHILVDSPYVSGYVSPRGCVGYFQRFSWGRESNACGPLSLFSARTLRANVRALSLFLEPLSDLHLPPVRREVIGRQRWISVPSLCLPGVIVFAAGPRLLVLRVSDAEEGLSVLG